MKKLIKSLIPSCLIRYKYPSAGHSVALSFDDGPKPGTTERILTTLQERNMSATFFVLGNMAESNPQLCQKIVDEGHELGNHGYSHTKFTDLSYSEFTKEIALTDSIIDGITGKKPRHFRPPNGALSISLLYHLTTKRKQPAMLWSQMVENEWQKNRDTLISEFQSMDIKAGDIILLHDVNEQTASALPDILDFISQKNLTCTTISNVV